MGKKVYQVTTREIDLSLCDAHPENYNKHSDSQINGLRLSLRKFGQVETVTVQSTSGDRFLSVTGHGVMIAARLENFQTIEARVIPASWPQEKVKAYLVASNEHARHSERDDLQYISILSELKQYDGLLEASGADEDEFDALMRQFGDTSDEVQLTDLPTQRPPKYAWVLIGVELVQYGSIASLIEQLAEDPSVLVETTVSDKEPMNDS